MQSKLQDKRIILDQRKQTSTSIISSIYLFELYHQHELNRLTSRARTLLQKCLQIEDISCCIFLRKRQDQISEKFVKVRATNNFLDNLQ